jgi:drug/metabolite transporter (DMT)-like permease
MSRRGWVLFAALSLMWGVPYLLIRVAVADLDPLIVAFGRTFLGALLLLPLALRRSALVPALRHWKLLLVYTVVEIVGPWWLLGHAETRLNSSTAGLIIAIVPLIAAVILAATGHDQFGPQRVIGLVLGFAGVATLVGLDVHLEDAAAIGALLLVTVGYAIGPIIISRSLSDVPAIGVITWSLIGSAVVYAPFTPLVWPATIPLDAGLAVVALAVVCTAGAFLVMFALIAEAGPSRMTLITYVNPAVAITLGALILNEPLTVGIAVGFPLVIVGSILATSRTKEAATPAESVGMGVDEPR